MRTIIKIKIIICLTILLSAGCDRIADKLDFSQPEVISVYPPDSMTGVPGDAVISVRFSKKMDKAKTNSEFSLTSSQGQVNGFFSWSGGKRLVFTPKGSLDESNVYTINISSDAEDADGNDLKEDYESVFYVNTDRTYPLVTDYILSYIGGIETEDHTGVLPDTTIGIDFSEPVDINTLYDGFVISPSVQGTFQWETDSMSITFQPLYYLDYGTNYTVTLNENIKDISGNQLNEQFTFNFTVGDDFEKPAVLSVRQDPPGTSPAPALYSLNDPWEEYEINYCIEKQNDIVIEFSEPVSRDTVYNAISVSPGVDFYISDITGNIVRISFNEAMESEENYKLVIASTLTDLQNNSLDREYEYIFFTNSINSVSPVVEYITDPVHYGASGWSYPPDPLACWTFNETEPLQINPDNSYNDIYIIFSADMEATSINMNIDKTAGSSSLSYMLVNPDWSDENLNTGGTRVYKIDIINAAPGNIYKLYIEGGKSGVKDINGNYMKEDFVQYISFPE